MHKKPRQRKCKVCGKQYRPWSTLQKCCGVRCSIDYAQREADKKFKAETRDKRLALKSRSDWTKEAQQACNAYIRERDKHEPCISCGRHHDGQWHAGHYRTTKAAPELRFEPLNIHKQCAPCNSHLSGNLIEYRIRLEKKIGAKNLAWLEGPHEPKKYTIDDLKAIKRYYQQLAKELKQRRAA